MGLPRDRRARRARLAGRRAHRPRGPRAALRALLARLGVAGHLAFAAVAAEAGARTCFALYVWCGLLTTQLVVQFWLLLGAALDVSTRSAPSRGSRRAASPALPRAQALAALLLLALPVRALLVAAAAAARRGLCGDVRAAAGRSPPRRPSLPAGRLPSPRSAPTATRCA